MAEGVIHLFERLVVESQANCNRSCWFCPRTHDRSGVYLDAQGVAVQGRMPTETILDILDQAVTMGFRNLVSFYLYSEPLLDNRCLLLAREARSRGLKPYLHTNGDVLRKNARLCREIADLYTFVVVGLYDYRNDDEPAVEKRFWLERLGGMDVRFSAIGAEGRRSGDSLVIPRALVPIDRRMSIPDLAYGDAPCHRPLLRMIVRYDGEMCACCEDVHGAFGLGNVYRQSLEDLWYSERHMRIVEDLTSGRRGKYGLCANCPLSPTAPAPAGRPVTLRRRQEPKPVVP